MPRQAIDREKQRLATLARARAHGRVIPMVGERERDPEDQRHYSKSFASSIAGAVWYQAVGEYDFDCDLYLILDGRVLARIELNEDGCWNRYAAFLPKQDNRHSTKFSTQRQARAYAERCALENLSKGLDKP